MSTCISREAYADMYGPTTGDRLRLADTELFIEVERDLTVYGEEVKFGGGKSIRDGMGQSQASRAEGSVASVQADPAVQAVRKRVDLVGSRDLTVAKPARQAIVEAELADGRTVRHHARVVRGTPDNPMTTQEIEAKALDLVAPVSGPDKAKRLLEAVRNLSRLRSVRDLRPILQA